MNEKPNIEEDEHDQDHDDGGLGLQKRMNTIKITTMKLGSHLMTITKRRTMMEGGVGPTFECLGNEDHDEDLLHTIAIACTTKA
jgi:hypothetical protein